MEKVWTTPTEFSDGIKAADRAISQAPEDVRAGVERFGRDPLFIRFAASFGAEAREDSSPGGGAASGADTVNSLIASEAYRNPRHPDHAKVSEQVRRHFEKKRGYCAGFVIGQGIYARIATYCLPFEQAVWQPDTL